MDALYPVRGHLRAVWGKEAGGPLALWALSSWGVNKEAQRCTETHRDGAQWPQAAPASDNSRKGGGRMTSPADELPVATFTKLKKEDVWGTRIQKAIRPGTVLDVMVVRKDGTYVTKTVEVFWVNKDEDFSLGRFVTTD